MIKTQLQSTKIKSDLSLTDKQQMLDLWSKTFANPLSQSETVMLNQLAHDYGYANVVDLIKKMKHNFIGINIDNSVLIRLMTAHLQSSVELKNTKQDLLSWWEAKFQRFNQPTSDKLVALAKQYGVSLVKQAISKVKEIHDGAEIKYKITLLGLVDEVAQILPNIKTVKATHRESQPIPTTNDSETPDKATEQGTLFDKVSQQPPQTVANVTKNNLEHCQNSVETLKAQIKVDKVKENKPVKAKE